MLSWGIQEICFSCIIIVINCLKDFFNYFHGFGFLCALIDSLISLVVFLQIQHIVPYFLF